MLEDEGHQAKDAPADHCHGQQLPGILQHGSRSDAQRSHVDGTGTPAGGQDRTGTNKIIKIKGMYFSVPKKIP